MEIVSVENLEKSYFSNSEILTTKVLQSINLEVKEGELVSIFGPSGSGKTTLLNIIGLLDTATSGEVFLFGNRTSGLLSRERAKIRRLELGFIFQSFNLLPELTALENIEISLLTLPMSTKERRDSAMEMLNNVDLKERANFFPSQLSGGQQQRVGIARALVHKPKLVLADEPTANLDIESARMVLNLMDKITNQEGTSFIFSTHDERVLEKVDRKFFLEDGCIK